MFPVLYVGCSCNDIIRISPGLAEAQVVCTFISCHSKWCAYSITSYMLSHSSVTDFTHRDKNFSYTVQVHNLPIFADTITFRDDRSHSAAQTLLHLPQLHSLLIINPTLHQIYSPHFKIDFQCKPTELVLYLLSCFCQSFCSHRVSAPIMTWGIMGYSLKYLNTKMSLSQTVQTYRTVTA